MTECIFCKIVAGTIPCTKLYEDEKCICFLDIAPASKGHALVVLKAHKVSLVDMEEESAVSMIKVARHIALGILKGTESQGFNLLMNNYKVAGQLVPHAHIHIVPRKENDGITIDQWSPQKYADLEADQLSEKIKSFL